MMESICIPHNTIPCNNLGYKLGCSVVVIAYSNILHNFNNGSKGESLTNLIYLSYVLFLSLSYYVN